MVNQNILNCLDSLQKTQDYISELEKKVDDLQQDKSIKSLLPYIQFSIYFPVKVYFKGQKCKNCDENGFVKSVDYFYDRHSVCGCQKLQYKFNCDKLDVFSTSYVNNKKVYDCVDSNQNLVSVDFDFVYQSFSDEHLKFDYHSVFYVNKEDCEKFCTEVNHEIKG